MGAGASSGLAKVVSATNVGELQETLNNFSPQEQAKFFSLVNGVYMTGSAKAADPASSAPAPAANVQAKVIEHFFL